MLVILCLFLAVVFMLMFVLMLAAGRLHPLYGFLFERVHTLEHIQHAHTFPDAAENFLEPCLGLAAVADKQVAVLNFKNVLRRRLKAVRFAPRRDKQADIRTLARYLACKVEGRKNRGNDAQSVPARLICAASARAQRERQRTQRKHQQYFFHLILPKINFQINIIH